MPRRKESPSQTQLSFRHQYLTQPGITPTDRLINELHTLTAAMHHAPEVNIARQLQAIEHLCCLFQTWREKNNTTSPKDNAIPKLTRSDVTLPPQDSPVEKPSQPSVTPTPQQHNHSPRVTPETQDPPAGCRWCPIKSQLYKRLYAPISKSELTYLPPHALIEWEITSVPNCQTNCKPYSIPTAPCHCSHCCCSIQPPLFIWVYPELSYACIGWGIGKDPKVAPTAQPPKTQRGV